MTARRVKAKGKERAYTFVAHGTVSFAVTVRAASLEEAVRLAQEAPTQSLCHQCCGGTDDSEWSTELDTEISYDSELVDVQDDSDGLADDGTMLAEAKKYWGPSCPSK